MDKQTALILGGAAVLIAVVFLMRPEPQQQLGAGPGGFVGGAGGGRVGPDGFPLPEDRVIGVLAQLTQLGGQIYDTVQSRRGTGTTPTRTA